MKTIQTLFVLALMLLSINTVSAQYGNNGYNNSGYGGGGRMNQMKQMDQMNQGRSQDKPKEIPAEVTIAKIMEKLKPALNLDVLQEIAISNVFTESLRTQGILMKAESSQEQKTLEFKALSEITDRKVNDFLNEDQKIKYKAFKEDSNSPKKSKRKK
jgi:hypothetical protein